MRSSALKRVGSRGAAIHESGGWLPPEAGGRVDNVALPVIMSPRSNHALTAEA
jgi:hypothetical protein